MMLRTKPLMIFTLVFAIVALFTYTEAGAVADGNGICEASEWAVYDCVNFDGNSLEYRGALDGQATLTDGTIVSVTYHFYLYNGASQNQLNIGIPLDLTDGVNNEAAVINCSQFIYDGGGDPTTDFLHNDYTRGVCRVAFSLASLPTDLDPPTNANFFIATDPSIAAFPLAAQLRQSRKDVWGGAINGPSAAAGTVVTAGRTLRSAEGAEASYELQGGQPVNVVGGRLLPLDHFKLCIPKASADYPYTFPTDYDCENIAYVDNECNIKTTGTDPFTGLGGFGFVW